MPQIDITLKSTADVGGFNQTYAKAQELQRILGRFGNNVFAPLITSVESADRQIQQKMTGWERGFDKLQRAFSAENIVKGLAGGLGFGGVLGTINTLTGLVTNSIEEHNRKLLEAEEIWKRIGKSAREYYLTNLPARARLAELQKESQDLLDKQRKLAGSNIVEANVGTLGAPSIRKVDVGRTADEEVALTKAIEQRREVLKEIVKVQNELAATEVANFFAPIDAKSKDNEADNKAADDAIQAHVRKVEEELQLRQRIMDGAAKAEARAAEMAKTAEEKAQREKTTAALRAARNEVESYDIALSNLAANPYLTDAEREPKRIELIKQQTAAIARLRAELEELAKSNPELAALIGGEIQTLGEKAARNEGEAQPRASAIDRARTDYRASQQDGFQTVGEGIEGGMLGYLARLGTMADQIAAGIENTLGAAVNGITQGIMNWDGTARGAWQAIGQIGRSVLQSFLQTLVQMGVQWAINAIIAKGTLFGIEATADTLRAARVAKENAAEAATLPAKTAGAAASGISSFGAALAFGLIAVALIASLAGGFAEGGVVRGPGTGTSDSILARLSNGEGVLTARTTSFLGEDFINQLNADPVNALARPYQPAGASTGSGIGTATETPSGARNYFLFDRAEFARLMQEDSEGWFHDMASQFVRRNGNA